MSTVLSSCTIKPGLKPIPYSQMYTQYTYAVVQDNGATLNVRANKAQAMAELQYWRETGLRCKLVLEKTPASWKEPCTETVIVDFDSPIA